MQRHQGRLARDVGERGTAGVTFARADVTLRLHTERARAHTLHRDRRGVQPIRHPLGGGTPEAHQGQLVTDGGRLVRDRHSGGRRGQLGGEAKQHHVAVRAPVQAAPFTGEPTSTFATNCCTAGDPPDTACAGTPARSPAPETTAVTAARRTLARPLLFISSPVTCRRDRDHRRSPTLDHRGGDGRARPRDPSTTSASSASSSFRRPARTAAPRFMWMTSVLDSH